MRGWKRLTTSEPYQTTRKCQRDDESLDEHLERRCQEESALFVRSKPTDELIWMCEVSRLSICMP